MDKRAEREREKRVPTNLGLTPSHNTIVSLYILLIPFISSTITPKPNPLPLPSNHNTFSLFPFSVPFLLARFAYSEIENPTRAKIEGREGQKIWSFKRGVSGVSQDEAKRWNLKRRRRRRGETNGNDDVFVAESGRWLRFNVQEKKELSAAKFHRSRTVTTIFPFTFICMHIHKGHLFYFISFLFYIWVLFGFLVLIL